MVLDKLGNSLKKTFDKIKESIFVDEKLINEIIKDLQRSLIQSDVDVDLVFELSKNIKERIKKEKVTTESLSKKDHLIKILYEEIVKFLGEEEEEIKLTKKPTKIMLVGLFGNGKTTTAGKLAKYYKKRGKKVALIQTDTWRPAAYEQLKQLSEQVGVKFFGDEKAKKNPEKIYKKFEKEFEKFDVVIVDTAGRDALSDDLIKELNKINKTVKPDEALLVMAADIGQAAKKQAQAFKDTVKVSGVIITKMDGTAKGGGALAACSVTGAKVKFIGVGEKIDDLESFDPESFVGRILGLGDIKALLEKTTGVIEEEKAKDLGKKFLKGEFNLLDMYEQLESMKKMGPLNKIMELIPGMSKMKIPKELLNVQQENMEKWKFAMESMTKEELENPEQIKGSRIKRIAQGSGVPEKTVHALIKQYKQSKKMMKKMKGGKMQKLMKQMGGGGLPPM